MSSFNARFRDESTGRSSRLHLKEAKILIQQWRQHYNTIRQTHTAHSDTSSILVVTGHIDMLD